MRIRALLRPTGVVVYLISYLLPAVGNPEFGLRDLLLGKHSIPGYFCAFLSIFWGFAGFFDPTILTVEGRRFFRVLLLPGLANPLLFTYLALSLRHSAPRTCRALSISILVCAASSFVAVSVMPIVPIYGFYVWLTGTITVIYPDLFRVVINIKARFSRKGANAEGAI